MPATACAAPMFASCALRPVSLWVFWLRTSIFVGFQPRPAAIRKIGLRACCLPGARAFLQKLRRRRSVLSLERLACCTSCKTGPWELPKRRAPAFRGRWLVSYTARSLLRVRA